MKLKQSPGDFRVIEALEFKQDPRGQHHVHLVTKEKLSTPDALDRIAREAGVPRQSIAYAGLKDRQAITRQYVSIEGGRVSIREAGLKVRCVGRTTEKITSKLSTGNFFRIVVRDLDGEDLARLRRNRRGVETVGLPNYFDDQRFGSLAHGQGFPVRTLALGDAGRALYEWIAKPARPRPDGSERSGDAKLRRILDRNWGDWEVCRGIARGPMYQAVFRHLQQRPGDLVGAIDLLPQKLKLISLFSYQSYLWNLGVRRFLEQCVRPRERVYVRSLCGRLICWRYLNEQLGRHFAELELPLIDHQSKIEESGFASAMADVLEAEGLAQKQLMILDVRNLRFREEPRPLVLRPEGLEVLGPWSDERNRGRLKVELRFKLPRGAYATLVVRRLLANPVRQSAEGAEREQRDRARERREGSARSPRGRAPQGPARRSPRPNQSERPRQSERDDVRKVRQPPAVSQTPAPAPEAPRAAPRDTPPKEMDKSSAKSGGVVRRNRRMSVLRRLMKRE